MNRKRDLSSDPAAEPDEQDASTDWLPQTRQDQTPELLASLRLQQVELELQNGELRRAQADLDGVRARYFDLYDLAPIGYCTVDREGLILEVNQAATALLGAEHHELLYQRIFQFIFCDDRHLYHLLGEELSASRERRSCELRVCKLDGTVCWVQLEAVLASDDNKVELLRLVLVDISERKTAEATAANENQILEAVAKGGPLTDLLTQLILGYESLIPGVRGSVLLLDASGQHLRHGAAPNLPLTYCQAIDGMTIGPQQGSCGTAAWTGRPALVEDITTDPLWIDFKDRAIAHGLRSCWSVPILGTSARVLGSFAFYRNVPSIALAAQIAAMERGAHLASIAIERKYAEDALRQSEQALREAEKVAHLGHWTWEPHSNQTSWSEEMGRIWQRDLATLDSDLSTVIARTIHPDDRDRVASASKLTARDQGSSTIEFRILRPDGSTRTVCAVTGKKILGEDGSVIVVTGVVQDITENKRAEERLRESEQRLRAIIETEPECVAVVDSAMEVLEMNAAGLAMFEADTVAEVRSRGLMSFVEVEHRDAFAALHQRVMAGEHGTLEYELSGLRGTRRWLAVHAAPMRDAEGRVTTLLGVTHDITARRRAELERLTLEAQLRQAHKMESVGRLAGGVAHDFNNMLAVILGHTEKAMEQIDPMQPLHADLVEIHQAAARSADLTRQLLAFARKQTVTPRRMDVNASVTAMLALLQRLIGENIKILWNPQPSLWTVKMDPTQMDQILTNLCVNARDAITDIGSIEISTSNCVIDADYCVANVDASPGDYVQLAVRDSGRGMDSEVLAQIFEPFFTTKSTGEGTGLGLATVYGAVTQNRGFLRVSSKPGAGTQFEVYLPRWHGQHPLPSVLPVARAVPRGTETILLVEDEPAILKFTKKRLEAQGYTIIAAPTPEHAIALAQRHHGEIDLLLTDVIMPEMNGRTLANSVSLIHPRIKCLFMSGYPASVVADHGVLDSSVNFIEKPFAFGRLAEAVRAALDGSQKRGEDSTP